MDEAMEVVEMATNSSGNQNLIIILLITLVAIVFVAEMVQKFRNIFGIRTKWDLREEKEQQSIKDLEVEIKSIKNEIDGLKKSESYEHNKREEFEKKICSALDGIKADMIDDKIQRLRSEILDFCNAARTREYSKESFDNLFIIYDQYEQTLAEAGKNNSQVDMGIAYVRKKYAEYLEKGFPTYEEV